MLIFKMKYKKAFCLLGLCQYTSVNYIASVFVTVFPSSLRKYVPEVTAQIIFFNLHFHKAPYRAWFAVQGSGRIKRESCN